LGAGGAVAPLGLEGDSGDGVVEGVLWSGGTVLGLCGVVSAGGEAGFAELDEVGCCFAQADASASALSVVTRIIRCIDHLTG
jgi:hypothetical protein